MWELRICPKCDTTSVPGDLKCIHCQTQWSIEIYEPRKKINFGFWVSVIIISGTSFWVLWAWLTFMTK